MTDERSLRIERAPVPLNERKPKPFRESAEQKKKPCGCRDKQPARRVVRPPKAVE